MGVDAGVRQHAHPAGRRDQVNGLIQGQVLRARNMRRATGPHDRVQLLALHVRLGGLDGGNDMRLANVAAGAGAHRLPVDREPRRRQPLHRLSLLRLAHFTGLVQPIPEPAIVQGEAVSEQVHLDQPAARLILDRQLDARDHRRAVAFQAAEVVDTGQGVMVGEGDHPKAGSRMRRDHLPRWQLPIAEDRVQVQVRPPVGYLSQWSPIVCGMPHPTFPRWEPESAA